MSDQHRRLPKFIDVFRRAQFSINKFIASNVNQLRRLEAKNIEGATKANVKRIDEIIKLYGERKMSNIATAENLIKGLRLTSDSSTKTADSSTNASTTKVRQPRFDN